MYIVGVGLFSEGPHIKPILYHIPKPYGLDKYPTALLKVYLTFISTLY